jgi:hypothetical protein
VPNWRHTPPPTNSHSGCLPYLGTGGRVLGMEVLAFERAWTHTDGGVPYLVVYGVAGVQVNGEQCSESVRAKLPKLRAPPTAAAVLTPLGPGH